jgi:hypothetical protein
MTRSSSDALLIVMLICLMTRTCHATILFSSLFEQPNEKSRTAKRKTPRLPKANDPFSVLEEIRSISMPQARRPLEAPSATTKFPFDLF